MILVDTSVWSLTFRRRNRNAVQPPEATALRSLIEADEEVVLPGIVLQELLSGIRETSEFMRLQEVLSGFPLILATHESHVQAARIANACRGKGVAVSTVVCLIAAMTIQHQARLFTADKDFVLMAEHCRLELFAYS